MSVCIVQKVTFSVISIFIQDKENIKQVFHVHHFINESGLYRSIYIYIYLIFYCYETIIKVEAREITVSLNN